jgi:hypothetical protein
MRLMDSLSNQIVVSPRFLRARSSASSAWSSKGVQKVSIEMFKWVNFGYYQLMSVVGPNYCS